MDYSRFTPRQRCRFWSDSALTVKVRWYYAKKGAKDFPSNHSFGIANWDWQEGGFNPPVGMQVTPQPTYTKGENAGAPPGDHYHGNPIQFQAGVPIADAILFDGFPPAMCRGFNRRMRGGLRKGGSARAAKDSPFAMRGGVLKGGYALVNGSRHYRMIGGVLKGGTALVALHSRYRMIGGELKYGSAGTNFDHHFRTLGGMLKGGSAGTNFEVGVETGTILPFGGSSAPTGYLLCNGASLDRTTFANLFAVIGTTFGAVDGSHFSLPDLRGRLPISAGSGPGLTPRTLGTSSGGETQALGLNELPSHLHVQQVNTSTTGGSGIGSAATYSTGSGTLSTAVPTTSQGLGLPFSIMNPWLALNFIIKT